MTENMKLWLNDEIEFVGYGNLLEMNEEEE